MRRFMLALATTTAALLLSGCVIFESVYDERFEDECDEIRNIDERRACYNDLERHQRSRDLERREAERAG